MVLNTDWAWWCLVGSVVTASTSWFSTQLFPSISPTGLICPCFPLQRRVPLRKPLVPSPLITFSTPVLSPLVLVSHVLALLFCIILDMMHSGFQRGDTISKCDPNLHALPPKSTCVSFSSQTCRALGVNDQLLSQARWFCGLCHN